jgi:hypothetical protein
MTELIEYENYDFYEIIFEDLRILEAVGYIIEISQGNHFCEINYQLLLSSVKVTQFTNGFLVLNGPFKSPRITIFFGDTVKIWTEGHNLFPTLNGGL